ncbi:MAG TPA: C25 family cysteine peptidase, partial [Cytophagaceae bacterium]|nr:C25 family cysteine peptidase [Cytophagaceae bacterium]
MVKKIFITLFLVFTVSSLVKAQTGREWIVSGQPYFKIPVATEAVYAMTFAQLNSAGVNTSDPTKLQLWFRGVEQSVFVNNNTLYFYGKGNDGALDSLIYEPYSARPNKYYSLYSDTTYYFLTVGSVNGKRLAADSTTSSTIQTNHIHTETIFYADQYATGQLYNSDTFLSPGDIGEGWVSNDIAQSGENPATKQISIPISNLYTAGTDPVLDIFLVGTNDNTHNVDIVVGSAVYSIPYFSGRITSHFVQSIPLALLTNNQPLNVTIRVKGIAIDQPDQVAVASVVLSYPQLFDVTGLTESILQPVNDNTAKTCNISGFANGAFLWDISSEGNYVNLNYTYASGTATVNVSPSVSKILYVNTFNSIIGINSVDMTPYPVNAELLIISHTKLLTGATAYANYKTTPEGGAFSVSVADITKLYNLYTYGEMHSMAIKRYCQEQIALGSPKYLFLIGKGVNYDYSGNTDQGYLYYRKNSQAFITNTYTYQQLNYRMENLIPPYGWPASDLYYTIP